MIQIKVPPPHLEVVVRCIDAKNPPADVNKWIEEGKLYKLKGTTQALNTDDISVIITDNKGEIIEPTASMGGFKSSRLEIAFELCKN